jgi:hypothetical protein
VSNAVVIRVKIDPDSDAAHRHGVLEQFVIPQMRSLAGFEKAAWMNDGVGSGVCIVTFDTAENADAAITPLTPEGGPPVISCGVFEVEVEAAAET